MNVHNANVNELFGNVTCKGMVFLSRMKEMRKFDIYFCLKFCTLFPENYGFVTIVRKDARRRVARKIVSILFILISL